MASSRGDNAFADTSGLDDHASPSNRDFARRTVSLSELIHTGKSLPSFCTHSVQGGKP